MRPIQSEVEAVMRETGMDELQARRHLVQRNELRRVIEEQRRRAAAECVRRWMNKEVAA
jgi:hypothetical protein